MRAVSVSIAIALGMMATGLSTVSAWAAPGLEPGVHADPGSPAAKEYALPLNQARDTGSQKKAGSGTVPFGAGIHPPGVSGNRSTAGNSHLRGTARTGGSHTGASNARTIAPAAILRAASEQGASGGDGSILVLIGGGMAILILGGFGGVLMRRSQRAGHPG